MLLIIGMLIELNEMKIAKHWNIRNATLKKL